jgi:hypothetical protein
LGSRSVIEIGAVRNAPLNERIIMLFLHSQVKTNPVSANAPAENQPRRNEENEGFFRSFFVFFVSSWLIFILYQALSGRSNAT